MNGTRHAVVDTKLGETTFAAKGDNLVGCYFRGHWYRPDESAFGDRVDADTDAVLGPAVYQFGQYLAGERTTFDVPLETHGDPFQERVWRLLGEIPFGETTTYGGIAQRLGDRTLARAVGGAVGRNPLCVFIPCHRVVGANRLLTGYAGGLGRKQHLLELEEPASCREARLF